jgi:hypothetical protein
MSHAKLIVGFSQAVDFQIREDSRGSTLEDGGTNPLWCGLGHCSKCSCGAFDADGRNPDYCRCGHHYDDHYVNP